MRLNISLNSLQGQRDYQEDRILYIPQIANRYSVAAVFDGHVGSECSNFMKDNFGLFFEKEIKKEPKILAAVFNTIKKLEYEYSGTGFKTTKSAAYKKMLSKLPTIPGTTAVITIVDHDNQQLYVANVGDSRSLLVRDNLVYQITFDHGINSLGIQTKKKFVQDNSAFIKDGYLWTSTRNGPIKSGGGSDEYGLNVIRTLGDPLFKARFNPRLLDINADYDIISWYPDLFCYKLQSGDIIILGSDGIYNFMSNAEIAKAAIKGGAGAVTNAALDNKSSDNVSCIVMIVQ